MFEFPQFALPFLVFAQSRELPIERLDPVSRATVFVAFGVLLFLLVFLVFFIVAAGRWARRYAQGSSDSSLSRSSLPPADDWANKPLAGLEDDFDEADGGDFDDSEIDDGEIDDGEIDDDSSVDEDDWPPYDER